MFRQFLRRSSRNIRLFTTQQVTKTNSKVNSSTTTTTTLPPNINTNKSSNAHKALFITITGGLILSFTVIEDLMNTPNGFLSTILNKPSFCMNIYDETLGVYFNDALLPSSDQLLPDWPTAPCYASLGVPLDTPAPPLLVVDLEKTLIASEHDPRFGWRHVKRPGADKFIEQLSNYFEIVIFCENDMAMMEHVLMAIDKDGRTHKLGPSAGEQFNGHILKRLDCMNRDVRRIILIDDSPVSSQKFPDNTILVKPYEDVRATGDTVLLDLIPVLQAMVHHDGIKDFRVTLDELGTHEAEEIVAEYKFRVAKAKYAQESKKNRGLGKFIRENAGIDTSSITNKISTPSTSTESSTIKEKTPNESEAELSEKLKNSNNLNKSTDSTLAKNQEKSKPVALKKKGAIFEWIEESEKERMETTTRKREVMENMYREKMMQKMKGRNNGSDFE